MWFSRPGLLGRVLLSIFEFDIRKIGVELNSHHDSLASGYRENDRGRGDTDTSREASM